MRLQILPSVMAVLLGLSAVTSYGELLLSDNFNVTGAAPNGVMSDPNYQINDGRQSGSKAVSGYTITGAGQNVQLGNDMTTMYPGGSTLGGNYLLIYRTGLRNDLAINADLTGNNPISFSFDLYLGASSGDGTWGAFSLSTSAGGGYPTTATTMFSFLVNSANSIAAYNGNNIVADPPIDTVPYLAGPFTGEYSSPSWTVVFSDVVDGEAGTGSPFGGNGTFAAIYYNGELIDGRALDNEFGDNTLYFGFHARPGGGNAIGIDNLSVSTVPEPAAVGYFVVAAGMGLAVLVVRRRRGVRG